MDVNATKPPDIAAMTSSSAGGKPSKTEQKSEFDNARYGVIYEKSDETEFKENYKVDPKKVQEMLDDSKKQSEALKVLVAKLINKQSVTYREALDEVRKLDGSVKVDEETEKKALQDISEDGYYGVKQTSERLLDFAKAISGGDPSKIELLRDAVGKGFEAAEKIWGEELPEISKQTYEAVMKGFDEWTAEAAAA